MIEEYLITKDIFFEKICYYYLIEFFFILSRMTVISALKVPLVARKKYSLFHRRNDAQRKNFVRFFRRKIA